MSHKKIVFLCLVGLLLMLPLVSIQAQDDRTKALEDILAQYVKASGPAAVVRVTTPDGTWTAAAGMADDKRAAVPEDRFRIGSMSKTFVAAAALMLVDDGIIQLDDPAKKWLPQDIVDNIANLDTVTIRQLLAMRSGIDDYLGTDEFWAAVAEDTTHDWTPQEALTYAYGLDPVFAPGKSYMYSNTNYLLMQIIIEKAAGQPLHKLLRDRVLDTLRLKDTYTQARETKEGGFVFGYEDFDGDGTTEEVSQINDGAGLGDGALISTTADMTAFYKALLQDKALLSPESMKELLNFQDDGEGETYSLGLASWETDYGQAIGHTGAVTGFVSEGYYLPESQTIVMVFVASDDGAIDDIATAAVAAILGDDSK